MTKDISLLLEQLQSEAPTRFNSVANKSTLRHELEKYEDLIIAGIASGHTARGFYEKLKDAAEIVAISNDFNPLRPDGTFRDHFIRVFHDYRDTLVAEGKVEKPASRNKKSKPSAPRKAVAKPAAVVTQVIQPVHQPELPQATLQSAEPAVVVEAAPVVAVKPAPANETIKPKTIIPKSEKSSFDGL